jgi:hypothetical protein
MGAMASRTVWIVVDGAAQTVCVFSTEPKALDWIRENEKYPGELEAQQMWINRPPPRGRHERQHQG